MKVVHVPFCFYPDPMGGTEVYVTNLVQELSLLGVDSYVVVGGQSDESRVYEGVKICQYLTRNPPGRLVDIYVSPDEPEPGFVRILEKEKPDLLHIHAYNNSNALGMVRAAKARKIPVVFTYHTPAASCQRGDMLRWGAEPCNGFLDLHCCARCTLELLLNRTAGGNRWKQRFGKWIAYLIGSLPPIFGSWLGRLGLQGGAWTALRMTELLNSSQATVRSFLSEVDHIVAVCQWVKSVLVINGVPEDKITLCRQGSGRKLADFKLNNGTPTPARDSSEPRYLPARLRLCFFGRLDATKGIHILIKALASIPEASLQLDIYGVAQGEAGKLYDRTLRQLANGDERIRFCPPLPPANIIQQMKSYDLLVVTSQCLETGPLVVLEAFEAGLPVVGSRLGGIAELVLDGENGVLVEASSVAAWTETLRRLSVEPDLMDHLRSTVKSPRAMKTVSSEMHSLYNRLVKNNSVPLQASPERAL